MKPPVTRQASQAFTLVELLTTIVIILLLAGMVLGGLKYAQDKQANEKTRVQLARLSSAIEEYKLDKGSYPSTGDSEDGLGNSNQLFLDLYWDSNKDGTGADSDKDQRIYASELDPQNKKIGWLDGTSPETYKIIDAWSNEIRYRSAKNEAGTPNGNTRNPDFDLWSPGKDGNSQADPKNAANQDDIVNQ